MGFYDIRELILGSWKRMGATKPGGIVSAAPGDAGWFHGHFGASKEPLRVLAFLGGYPRRVKCIPEVDLWGLNLGIKGRQHHRVP